MNRSLFTSLFSLTALFATAQIPNAGFEEWKKTTFGTFEITEPKGWSTQNVILALEGGDASVVKTTDAHGGSAAMKLTNVANENNLPAYATSFEVALTGQFPDKFPVNGKPSAFEGFYKYEYPAQDTFLIFVSLYKDGINIGSGQFESSDEKSAYTKFSVEIEYFSEETPDSASINIYAGSFNLKPGSTLYIDDLSFAGMVTGVAEQADKKFSMQVYPNPAQENTTISFEQLTGGNTSIGIYDLSGNEIVKVKDAARFEKGRHEEALDLSALADGMYLVRIMQPGGEKTIRLAVGH